MEEIMKGVLKLVGIVSLQIWIEPLFAGAEPENRIITRTPNITYDVVQDISVDISNGAVSDFMLNIPYPQSNQYQDIEWKTKVPRNLLKPYKESGDQRIFFTEINCQSVPRMLNKFRARLYRIETDFSKIGKIVPYKKSTRLYKDNIRARETRENMKNGWLRDSVQALTKESGGNPLKYARSAYAHVVTNFTYGLPPVSDESELIRTIKAKKGDCGLLSGVYIALLRAGGIPARLMACLRPIQEEGSCHCWAEFYLEGYGWFPVDVTFDLGNSPSYRHFGNYDDHTVVMTRGTNFEVASKGGQKLTMGFCQSLCFWFWNWNGANGKVDVSASFTGTTVE